MLKKLTVFTLILCVFLSVSACGGNNGGSSSSSKNEDIYASLKSLISNPDGDTDLTGSFTFIACILSEPFEQTFDDSDKVYMYQEVYISREINKTFYVDITDIKNPLPANSYATITGTVSGSIYWTEDNKQVKVLDIHATKMVEYKISDKKSNTSNKISLKEGTYSGDLEFVGAHYSKTSFNNVVVLYIKFTNTASDSPAKINGLSYLLNKTDMFPGDEYVDRINNTFKPDELDGSALDATSIQAYTNPGKTQLYYAVLTFDGDIPEDPTLYIDVYDDGFACTNAIVIPIAENLAAMKK